MNLYSLIMTLLVILCPLVNGASAPATAPPRDLAIDMGAPFHDNAILQRNMKVPVWGWAKQGAKVTVEFAGQKKSAIAGKDGKWMLSLDELKANAKPTEMVISDSTGKSETLKNILIGEVWLASGQSNMQWVAAKCDVGRVLMVQIAERVKAGKEKAPIIREALVTNYFATLHPIEHAKVKWSPAGENSSAIAYAFAYKLHAELKVPIGILNCSFSQTSIQAWTPRVGFAGGKDPYTQAIYKKVLESDPTTSEHKTAWNQFYSNIENTLKENEAKVKRGEPTKMFSTKTPANLSSNRDATWLFNARLNPMIPYTIRGAIWNQGYANAGEGLVYYNNLHSMIRGWRQLWNKPELPVYFHQFYSPRQKGGWTFTPTLSSAAEMRLGTWLARDIPHSGMASQIDMTGGIHYTCKTIPGQRLALHALKNQYGQNLVTNGPMFNSYSVSGDKLTVHLDHAKGGLVVGETGTDSKRGIAKPTVIANGEAQVKFFYIADEDKVWHPASVKIENDKLTLSSPNVKSPRGVTYGTGGVGFEPGIYNKALLPLTPFTYYDNKMVTSENWPSRLFKVAGVTVNPLSVGKLPVWRTMPLLSTQFRDNAVLQAGQSITFFGSALHDHGYEAKGKAVIKLSFAGIEKTVSLYSDPAVKELGPGETRANSWKEWRVTLPAMKASAEPKTLKVTFLIDGEVAHERVCKNIVIGDVWYVATAPLNYAVNIKEKSSSPVRMITRKAKRFESPRPSRYSICVSRLPNNRFASVWEDASGFAAALGHRISRKTGNPVGIVFMQSGATGKPAVNKTELKSWIKATDLKNAPSLMADYKDLAVAIPGTTYFKANTKEYMAKWKTYWGEYIPKLMATKSVPDAAPWGSYPTLASSITTNASKVYNVMVHSLTPGSFKGIVFLSSENMFRKNQGANFAQEISALANSWKNTFGGDDPHFLYSVPTKALVPQISLPKNIKGLSTAIEVNSWLSTYDEKTPKNLSSAEIEKVINAVLEKTSK